MDWEDTLGEVHHEPSSPRAAEVRAILEEHVFEELEDQAAARSERTIS